MSEPRWNLVRHIRQQIDSGNYCTRKRLEYTAEILLTQRILGSTEAGGNDMGRPGKFERCPDQAVGEELYLKINDGHAEGSFGDVNVEGYYALLTDTGIEGAEHVVTQENIEGFFNYTPFPTANDARTTYEELQGMLAPETEDQ